MKPSRLLLLVLAAAGCAPATLPFAWETPHADLRALTEKYPRAVAVIVKREDRLSLALDQNREREQGDATGDEGRATRRHRHPRRRR